MTAASRSCWARSCARRPARPPTSSAGTPVRPARYHEIPLGQAPRRHGPHRRRTLAQAPRHGQARPVDARRRPLAREPDRRRGVGPRLGEQQAPYRGYGYQWWLRSFWGRDRVIEAFAAQGLGGQFIVVIPDLRLVAAFTGWNVNERTEQPFEMLQRYIVPASDAP